MLGSQRYPGTRVRLESLIVYRTCQQIGLIRVIVCLSTLCAQCPVNRLASRGQSYLFQKYPGKAARCAGHSWVARPVDALGGLQPPLVPVHHFIAHVLGGVNRQVVYEASIRGKNSKQLGCDLGTEAVCSPYSICCTGGVTFSSRSKTDSSILLQLTSFNVSGLLLIDGRWCPHQIRPPVFRGCQIFPKQSTGKRRVSTVVSTVAGRPTR